MSITETIVLKTARLARIRIPEEKIPLYITELNNILKVIDQLQEVNVEGIKPIVNPNEFNLSLREDEVTDGNITDKILQNAPKRKFDYFAVPKVIE